MAIPQDRPVYRILATAGFFGPDDHLYPEGSVIAYDDTPNEEMEPLNTLAHEKLREYITVLDQLAEEVAKKNGRSVMARPRTLDEAIAQSSADARRVQLVQGGEGVPLMGGKNRGASKIAAITETTDAPEDGRGSRGRLSLRSSSPA